MQSCMAAPGGSPEEGEQRRLPLCESDIPLSDTCSGCPLSGSPPSSSPGLLPQKISFDTKRCCTTVTNDDAPLPCDWDHLSCIDSSAASSARNEKNDGKTNNNLLFTDNSSVHDASSTTVHGENKIHTATTVHSNHSSFTDSPGVEMQHNDHHKGVASLGGAQGRGEEDCENRNELLGFSPSGRRADGSCWRDGLLFFGSRDSYADGAANNSGTAGNNDAENEESVQPRNFFPFNSIFAVAGWGSGAGWFFNSSGPAFGPAADRSPDVATAGASNDSSIVAEQGSSAGVYLPRFAGVPPSRNALPPLLSIGKSVTSHKSGSGSLQQGTTALGRPVVNGAVLLASPWHRQEGRHSAPHARMNIKRKRADMSTRKGSVSNRNTGLHVSSVTTSRHGPERSPERSAISSSRSIISVLTKSVGSVLWNCFCKLLRSRINFISKSAADVDAAIKAAKKIRRVPGILRLFRNNAIGLALQDFSMGEVLKQWASSLLYLSGKQAHGKSVFLGPAEANHPRCAAAAVAAAAKEQVLAQKSLGCTVCPLLTTTTCYDCSHVFITPKAGRMLWRSACSLIANPVTAMYFQCYRLASLGTVVYVTSVVHWWQPQLGIRRTLDVLTVCIVSGIHVVVACVNAAPLVLLVYLLLCCTGIACYVLGCSLALQGFHEEAAVCHIGLHSLCTIANMLLYYSISV